SSRRRHTISKRDWSSDVCSSDLDVLQHDTILSLAEKYHKQPAQIIGRWNIQNDVLFVVKAASSKHQKENLNIFDFELSEEDMKQIDKLDKGEPGRVEGQHPNEYEEFD